MKMRQRDVVAAYRAALELGEVRLPYRKAREVAALRRRLREEYETAEEREMALARELGAEPGENGRFRTREAARAGEFRRRHEEQMNEEAEIGLPVVDLSEFADTVQISPNCLEALEGIVIFEKGADA